LRVCVFCGANPGARPAYAEATADLARLLMAEGIGVVHGGGHVGLMGVLADTMLAEGVEPIGVMPQALVDKEIGHRGLSDLRVVGSMHERKALMAELSDAFIALPGGLGTLDELAEALTLIQTGKIQEYPVVLIGTAYWQPFMTLLREMVSHGAVAESDLDLLMVTDDLDEAMRHLETHAVGAFGLTRVVWRPRWWLGERPIMTPTRPNRSR
jgi:uncharacterized protein (TIGR00730 family)